MNPLVENYKDFAAAIIKAACQDYVVKPSEREEIREWFHSKYFADICTLDPDALIEDLNRFNHRPNRYHTRFYKQAQGACKLGKYSHKNYNSSGKPPNLTVQEFNFRGQASYPKVENNSTLTPKQRNEKHKRKSLDAKFAGNPKQQTSDIQVTNILAYESENVH
jgi:YesN/AraC family two-component response regulator